MAPVAAGYCRLESLECGEVTLWHLALANDHLAVTAENKLRAAQK